MPFRLIAHRRRAALSGLLAVVLLATLWAPTAAWAAAGCQSPLELQVPVTVPGVADASVHGELCVPGSSAPDTVLLLVHGGTYTHVYWDWPLEPGRYSYVRKALSAGYATFNVDRLGAGQSTHPPSDQVTFGNGAEALHDVITQLRSGGIGGHPFSHVVWVGHSFGTIHAWVEASMYHDVDAFVLTGGMHNATKPSFLRMFIDDSYPAFLDPRFSSEPWAQGDTGYLTTIPGSRGGLFYYSSPNADPDVIARDEELKDTYTLAQAIESGLIADVPPDSALSRAITVPTLLVLGDHDNIFCGPPDGFDCTAANIAAHEAPYYSPQAQLEVQVTADTGHDLQLHTTAPQTTGRILDWVAGAVG